MGNVDYTTNSKSSQHKEHCKEIMLITTIRNKTRNSEIRKQTQVKDMIVKIKKLNEAENDIYPDKRKRTIARQKRRWLENLTINMRIVWTKLP